MPTPIDKLKGTPAEIIAAVKAVHPAVTESLLTVKEHVPFIKRQVSEYQGAALYALAAQYNRTGATFLEIGTAWGYSAACLAEAAPEAHLVTLNPKVSEFLKAAQHLAYWGNVTPKRFSSWDYFDRNKDRFDLIFIDGDHNQVHKDLIWWQTLNPGGLFLFHDYAPDGSWRPCQVVYDEVNRFAEKLGRPLDVLIEDERGVALAGFYRAVGE